MNTHLHGGKWSPEEEQYASALIEAFKAGVLPADDIEEVCVGVGVIITSAYASAMDIH